MNRNIRRFLSVCTIALLAAPAAHADTITDWNTTAVNIIADAIKPPPPAARAVALVQASVYTAVNSITQKYPASELSVDVVPGASVDAAIAAANHTMLLKLLPKSVDKINAAYQDALINIPDGQPKQDGITIGEQATDAVIEFRAADKIGVPESYRPNTTPGVYVPTVTPVASTWSANRLPWALKAADQFRPGDPPDLQGDRWAQDYNEIKEVGAHDSSVRTPEQTAAARFWEATSPKIYFPVVRSVTSQPDRDLTRNARLFAMVSQATDDALIAVFDAKYHYQFWRPMTAIRNGDLDDNDATERRANWQPLIKTPMHPEYPCAHCIVSGATGTVLKIDLGDTESPLLTTSSPFAEGTRSWSTVDDFIQEVSNARVWEGVHYRYSAEVGTEMGRLVANQVASTFPSR